MTDTQHDDFAQLWMEILLGMRVQFSGRDQNAMINYLRSLPKGILDQNFIVDKETVIRIEDPVPPSLTGQSWCIIPHNHGSVACQSRNGAQVSPGELVLGVSFEDAQALNALLYADAGACVELVYPRKPK